MRRTGLVVLGLLLVSMPVAAQEKGTVELGVFGRSIKYPASFGRTRAYDKTFDDLFGIGGRLGYFVANNLALEVDGSYNVGDLLPNPPAIYPTDGSILYSDMHHTPYHLQLVYNVPMGEKLAWEVGGGGSLNKTGYPISRSDIGFGGITGLRWRPSNRVNFRFEGTADIAPSGYTSTDHPGKSNTFLGLQVGASLLFGGKSCDHAMDMISIQPMSATLAPGESQTFTSTASYCGKPDAVTYTMTGPGTIDAMTGRYTAAGPGTAMVTAHSTKGKAISTASVTVRTPVPVTPQPPAPPARQTPPPTAVTPPAAQPAARYDFALTIVHFEFNHSDLTQGGIDSVKAVAATLKAHPDVTIELTGHTDWVGTNAYNMKLSQARAETVRQLLVAEGVAENRLLVKWRGEEEPTADNNTVTGRALNRRTEIKQDN